MAKECYVNSKKVGSIRLGSQNTNCLTYIPEDIKLDLDPLDVTVVGSPTISNGVVSGFSTSNHLKTIPQNITDKSPNAFSWEIVFKIEHKAGYQQYLYVQPVSYQSYFGINASNKMIFNLYNSSSSSGKFVDGTGKTALTDGGIYWLKYEFTGTAYVMSLSTDGISYTTEFTQSTTTKLADRGVNWLVGVSTQTNYEFPVKGKIDLSESYIKINNEIWWQGGTGQLTLKAGSKVYVPNGFEEDGTTRKFDEVVIESNKQNTTVTSVSGEAVVFYRKSQNSVSFKWSNKVYSGTSDVSEAIVYRTDLNKTTDGSDDTVSLPLGIITVATGGVITSIDQVFNDFGYIGSTLFALSGVKGLIPDGFKENGTYISTEFENNVLTLDCSSRNGTDVILLGKNYLSYWNKASYFKDTYPMPQTNQWWMVYDSRKNEYYGSDNGADYNRRYNFTLAGEYTITNGQITSLIPNPIQNQNTTIEVRHIYKGSQLIWGYNPSEVIFQSSTAGTYTVDIATSGYYNVKAVGGGSGGAYVYSSKFSDGRASGGSGAGFVGIVYLTAGNHTIKVGAGGSGKAYESNGQTSATSTAGGQSSIDNIIVAGGGGAAKAGIHGATQTAGAGGTLTYDSSKVKSYTLAKNGNTGTTVYGSNITGASSVLSGTTYGVGGNAGNSYTTAGENGYVFISAV